MLKNLFFVLLALILLISGVGYYVYNHRVELTEKAVSYAMNNILYAKPDDAERQDWINDVVVAGFKGISRSMQNASGSNQKITASKLEFSGDNLSNIAGIFANTSGNQNENFNQLAQVLLQEFGGVHDSRISSSESANQHMGHDINARDAKGRTLLMNVCRVDVSPKVVKMLLKYGADIHAVDNKGRTALMYAVALNQNPEVVSLLIEMGADIKQTDSQGKSVFDYAEDAAIKDLLGAR